MAAVLARVVLWLLSLLPLRLAHALGTAIGRLLWWLPTRQRWVTLRNLRLCFPELDAGERRGLARASLAEVGKSFMELGALWRWPLPRLEALVREVDGLEHLEAARAGGRAAILAAPHLGAWELLGLYCAQRWPMATLYRRPRLRDLDTLLVQARERAGAHAVAADGAGMRELYRALQRGWLVGILPDQHPKAGHGVFAPFFGTQALTMTLPLRAVDKTGAGVVFGWAERLPRGRGYRLHFRPPPANLAQPTLTDGAAALNSGVEACVRELPSQYHWTYKRFSKRPPGAPEIYPKRRPASQRRRRRTAARITDPDA